MIKKTFTLIFFVNFLSSCHERNNPTMLVCEQHNDQTLITCEGKPTKLLQNLFQKLGYETSDDLDTYNQIGQKNLLRTGERWQMKPKYEQHRQFVMNTLEQAGWKKAIQPLKKDYDYVIILGSTVQRMRERIEYFLKLVKKKNIRFKKAIFHVSDRPLDLAIEPNSLWPEYLKSKPKTEHEAALLLWNQLCKHYRIKLAVEVINHPMIVDEQGQKKRPHTGDVMDLWLKQRPNHGSSILAISNQPYCQYQKAVLLASLLKNNTWKRPVSFEVVGPENRAQATLTSVYLDNIARYIYAKKMILDLLAAS